MIKNTGRRLFDKHKFEDVKQERFAKLRSEVDGFSRDRIFQVDEAKLVSYLVDKYQLTDPPILDEKRMQQEPIEDTEMEINHRVYGPRTIEASSITLIIPFAGNPHFFEWSPEGFWGNVLPCGAVRGNELRFTYKSTSFDKEELTRLSQNDLKLVRLYLEQVSHEVNLYNNDLATRARDLVSRRKAKVSHDEDVAESLGIPIRRKKDPNLTYALPDVRRKSPVPLPTVSNTLSHDPTLPQAEYSHILDVIEHMVKVMERSPNTFFHMGEEALRDILLVILNSHYESAATGETFNGKGKTDILIRHHGENAFIAECKFWDGPKSFNDAIDQLLSYTTWRDTKTALIVFNRKRNFSKVVENARLLPEEHPCYTKTLEQTGETRFEYIFHHPNDENRELFLSVLLFDVPQPSKIDEEIE